MLRRKFMFSLGPLVALLLITAVAAIWLLQGVLRDLNAIYSSESQNTMEQLNAAIQTLRWLVLGLAAVFVLLINVSVIILLRIAGVILRPVETLVTATRELGQEHFDYRVKLDQHDEFDDLGKAYNDLAQRLQNNEQRKIEVLQQVAVAINHEVNNALAVVDLQLQRVSRQASQSPGVENTLKQIHESLARVTDTVHALKQVRRIVLTDYGPGTKMLDLERSTREEHLVEPSPA